MNIMTIRYGTKHKTLFSKEYWNRIYVSSLIMENVLQLLYISFQVQNYLLVKEKSRANLLGLKVFCSHCMF